jgi:hypothetical protein
MRQGTPVRAVAEVPQSWVTVGLDRRDSVVHSKNASGVRLPEATTTAPHQAQRLNSPVLTDAVARVARSLPSDTVALVRDRYRMTIRLLSTATVRRD